MTTKQIMLNTSASVHANKIRLLLQHYSQIIVLEGTTDERFFSGFCTDDRVYFLGLNTASAKESVINTILYINQKNVRGVIAIVDLDFDKLQNSKLNVDNLFYTDDHDLECMIAKDLEAFSKISSEYFSKKKLKEFVKNNRYNLLDILFEQCKIIGFIRFMILRNALEFKINNLIAHKMLAKIINFHSFTLDVKKLVELLLAQNISYLEEEKVIEEYERLRIKYADLKWHEISRGHDVVTLITISIKYCIGPKKKCDKNIDVLHDEIDSAFRVAYPLSSFKNTLLYKDIIDWNKTNNPSVNIFN